MDDRVAFYDWLESRPSHWDRFTDHDLKICSRGSPREGEYRNQLAQQLWECWRDARAQLSDSAPADSAK